MDTNVEEYIESLEFGRLVQYKNMAVVPLFSSVQIRLKYLSMSEALKMGVLAISEISESGSVPELIAINNSDVPVLLLDGEELVGAKQNRVLNTTILLKERSKVKIPVSCTERGRWSYASSEFAESNAMAASSLRHSKSASVSESLACERTFRSDQCAVWANISMLQKDLKVSSPTSALRDTYDTRSDDISAYLKRFKCSPAQKGMLVFVNGRIVGMEVISRSAVLKILYPKLIKSYAIDALRNTLVQKTEPSILFAQEFINTIKIIDEKRYDSMGYGFDYRYAGRGISGSALVYKNHPVHISFLSSEDILVNQKVYI